MIASTKTYDHLYHSTISFNIVLINFRTWYPSGPSAPTMKSNCRYQCLRSQFKEVLLYSIVQSVLFEEPTDLPAFASHKLNHSPHALLPRHQEALMDYPCANGGPLREWHQEFEFLVGEDVPVVSDVVFIWKPFLKLIFSGKIRTLGVTRPALGNLSRSHLFNGLPKPVPMPALEESWDRQHGTGDVFDDIAFLFGKWASSQDAADGRECLWEGMASQLFGFGAAFAPGCIQMRSCRSVSGRRKVYDSIILIRCLLLGGLLKDCDSMREVILQALDIALPAHIVSVIRSTFMQEMKIPSESVLSRYRVVLDCGFMMCMRDQLSSSWSASAKTIRCLLTDSSPQGFENWQISEVFLVSDVVAICKAVDLLSELLWCMTNVDQRERRASGRDRWSEIGWKKS